MKSVLIVRLGAMGDIIHSLPGAASIKHSFPNARITWVVEPKWVPLLEGNGFVDRFVLFDRGKPGSWKRTMEQLRADRYDLAVDFQGLVKSALIAHLARAERIAGFGPGIVRERIAGWFYSNRVPSAAIHVVDQALDLAKGAGASNLVRAFPLPAGEPEGKLPEGPFALASPLAGWTSKQWPLEYYEKMALFLRTRLGMPLVLNGAPGAVPSVPGTLRHESGLRGSHRRHPPRRARHRSGQRPPASRRRAQQSRRRHLRTHRPRPERPLRRRLPDLPCSRRENHPPARQRDRSLHARHHARTGLLRSRSPRRLPRLMAGRKHWFPKPYADLVARLRVPAGFIMLGAFGLLARPTATSLLVGLPISLCGLALRAWAAGHLAKDQRLATSGPYAFTRNPLYLGTLVTALGLAAAGHSIPLAVIFTTLFALVYLPAIELEEQHLTEILMGYSAYAARVPLLLPRWPEGLGAHRFTLALYRKNREYQALFGWVAAAAWLLVRLLVQFPR